MTANNRAEFSLGFSDGTRFSTWQSVSMRESFVDPLGSYEFEITPPRPNLAEYNEKLVKGALVKVYIDDSQQAAVLITRVVRTVSPGAGVTFSVSCKSVLATPYEGSVDLGIGKRYKADVTVQDAVIEALSAYGFDEIGGDTKDNIVLKTGLPAPGWGKPPIDVKGLKHKDILPQPGETAYAYCSRIFSRVGLVLHVDATGVLSLAAPNYEQLPSYIVEQRMGGNFTGDAMVGEVTVSDTNDGQFSEIVILGSAPDEKGQTRTNKPGHRLRIGDIPERPFQPNTKLPTTNLDRGLHSYRSFEGSTYKPKIHVDKNSRDNMTASTMAKVMMGMRSADAFQVKCTVDGVRSATGRIWTPNTTARVVIEALDFNEKMWMLDRSFKVDIGGQMTEMTFIPLDSLVLGEI